jgi:hypothetical protein
MTEATATGTERVSFLGIEVSSITSGVNLTLGTFASACKTPQNGHHRGTQACDFYH